MERYRIILVPEELGGTLARSPRRRGRTEPQSEYRREEALSSWRALLGALQRLKRRGPGPAGWATASDDPLVFLLDTIDDALLVRGLDGQLLFANRRAQEMALAQRPFCEFEEFEYAGQRWHGRGLRCQLPDGSLSFTLVSQQRRV